MDVILPTEYTYGMLTSSNVPENEFPTWTAPAVRAVGDQVIHNHKVYKALVALTATTDVNPETGTAAATKWLLMGATNRWRMFDDKVGTLTTNPGSISVDLTLGEPVSSIAFFNVTASYAVVRVLDSGRVVVYENTVNLLDYEVSNWHEFFYKQFGEVNDFVILDMPGYGSGIIQIELVGPTPTTQVSVGAVVIGYLEYIGEACYGSNIGTTDYSRKEFDEFGEVVLVPRAFSKYGDFAMELATPEVTRVQRLMGELRSRLCVWIGYSGYESTIIYGFYKEFSLTYGDSEWSEYQLRIEGVV